MKRIFIGCFLILMIYPQAYAGQIPQGQDIGSRVRDYENEKMREGMNKKLATPGKRPPAINEAEVESLRDNAASLYVSKIIAQKGPGVDELVNDKGLAELTNPYKNKMLSIEDMKALAGSITKYCANDKLKAYVPRQSFGGGIMYINLVSEEPEKK